MTFVRGEQHERAVEAATRAAWLSLPGGARRMCDGSAPAEAAIDAYLTSLREQGVVLVDLREDECQGVLWAIRLGLAHDDGFSFPRDQNRVILRSAQDAIERRFGGNEGKP